MAKCGECSVLVNELLTFVSNKIDSMTEPSIIQICDSAFTEEDIDIARATLNELTKKRNTRRGDAKKTKNLQDIIKILKETSEDDLPTFVAKDLNKLPPVYFDHIDATSFLKEFGVIKAQISKLQNEVFKQRQDKEESFSSELELHSSRNVSFASVTRQTKNGQSEPEQVVTRCVATARPCDSSPPPPPPPAEVTDPRVPVAAAALTTPIVAAALKSPAPSACAPLATTPTASNTPTAAASAAPSATSSPRSKFSAHYSTVPVKPAPNTLMNSAAYLPPKLKEMLRQINMFECSRESPRRQPVNTTDLQIDTDGFKPVTHKKYKNNRGTATGLTTKLKVVQTQVPLYVSRFSIDTNAQDVREYIEQRGKGAMNIEPIFQRKETDFKSFKIYVPKSKLDSLLQNDFWPEGIAYRIFKERRPQLK